MKVKVSSGVSIKKVLLIIGIVIIAVGIILGTIFGIRAGIKKKEESKEDIRYTIQGYVIDQYGDGVSNVSFFVDGNLITKTSEGGIFFLENIKKDSLIKISCNSDKILLPYDEIKVKENIFITKDSKGLLIKVTNNDIAKKTATFTITDRNGSMLANVVVKGNGKTIGRTNSKGVLEVPISEDNYKISFSLNYFYFADIVLNIKDIGKTIVVKGNYIADTVDPDDPRITVINYIFDSNETDFRKNYTLNYLHYENGSYIKHTTMVNNGSYGFPDFNRFTNLTVFSSTADVDGMYYFADEVYFSNQNATIKMTKCHKIDIEVDAIITEGVIYLKSLDESTDKMYYVKDGILSIYTNDLNYEFYSIFTNGTYGGKLKLVDENDKTITSLNSGYSRIILK
ncbi:MAG: hypothetical protein MR485_02785 [Mollicutes bacterium]|nr:hypothetical protein [Mollicutes bacterium]